METKNLVQDLEGLIRSIPNMDREVHGPDGDTILLTAEIDMELDDDDDLENAGVRVEVYVYCDRRHSALLDALTPEAEQINECLWLMRQGGEGIIPFESGELQGTPLEELRAVMVGTQELFLTAYAEDALRKVDE